MAKYSTGTGCLGEPCVMCNGRPMSVIEVVSKLNLLEQEPVEPEPVSPPTQAPTQPEIANVFFCVLDNGEGIKYNMKVFTLSPYFTARLDRLVVEHINEKYPEETRTLFMSGCAQIGTVVVTDKFDRSLLW